MFRNNKVNMVISVLVAIILWAYVVGQVNPETQQKYESITVQIKNENVLRNQGLAIEDPGDMTVDVTISGTRRAVKKVDKSDIRVSIDAAELSKGDNTVDVKVTVPSGISVSKVSRDTIDVRVADLVSRTKTVKAKFTGKKTDGTEVGEVTADPKTVEVSGTEAQVSKVSYVKASVKRSEIKEKETTVSADLTAVDADGNEVNYVKLSQNTADITATLESTKTVSLKVNVTGSVPDGYEIKSRDVPTSVKIKGRKSVLNKIDSVTAADVSLDNVTSSRTIRLSIDLPAGVSLADSDADIGIRITLNALKSGTFTMYETDITASNIGDGLDAKISSGSFKVTVSASEDILADITSGDIKLTVDCSGLEKGKHKVKIDAAVAKVVSVTVSPAKATVTLSEN